MPAMMVAIAACERKRPRNYAQAQLESRFVSYLSFESSLTNANSSASCDTTRHEIVSTRL